MSERARRGALVVVLPFAVASTVALEPAVRVGTTGPAVNTIRGGAPPNALPNDNRSPAGRLAHGVLTLRLEAREASWYPEGESSVSVPTYAFAEPGRAPSIPGPMIRVPAGTEVRVTVRNTLSKAIRIRGLQDHVSAEPDSIVVEPNATQHVRFRADVPGTYLYWARTETTPPRPWPGRSRDAMLAGAFIVDPVGMVPARRERVLVITSYSDSVAALGVKSDEADAVLRRELVPRANWFVIAVNGLSWPHTERLAYTVGDTIQWRVINASSFPHPMHLHGFYFDVYSRGDVQRDTVFTASQRRTAVTEWMLQGTTMRMTWVPTRPGNWLFHCHLVTHIAEPIRLGQRAEPPRTAHVNHAEQGMAGLVMGIRVSPNKPLQASRDPETRRKLRLFITERANVYGDKPGYSYVLQEGPTPPAPDSIRALSSTVVLRQGEPTAITVVNVAKHMATIHWHGMELESFYDGVGDWSGWRTRVAPVIAPGDSFMVRLTPPRAGTFIYHTHTSEAVQLASGLYGMLLVRATDARPDTTERSFLLAIGGPHDDAPLVVNGLTTPSAVELRAGIAHRFRFINISPLESHTVQLMSGDDLQRWRAVAKDGADLPRHRSTEQPALVVLHPGETYDFEVVRQRPESLTLRITSPETVTARTAAFLARGVIPRILTAIPVMVR